MNRRSWMKTFAALGALAAAGKAWATGVSVPATPKLTMDDFHRLAAGGTAEKWVVLENLQFDLDTAPVFRDVHFVHVNRCVFNFPQETWQGLHKLAVDCSNLRITNCRFIAMHEPEEDSMFPGGPYRLRAMP